MMCIYGGGQRHTDQRHTDPKELLRKILRELKAGRQLPPDLVIELTEWAARDKPEAGR